MSSESERARELLAAAAGVHPQHPHWDTLFCTFPEALRAIEAARRQAIEECAAVADDLLGNGATTLEVVDAIRSLASKEDDNG